MIRPATLFPKIEKWVDLIRPYVYADRHKMYSNEEFETNLISTIGDPLDPGAFIPGLKEFIEKRYNFLDQQFNLASLGQNSLSYTQK